MKRIKFRYIDKYTHGNWAYQECIVESLEECRKIYGLDEDPDLYEYEILSVKNI